MINWLYVWSELKEELSYKGFDFCGNKDFYIWCDCVNEAQDISDYLINKGFKLTWDSDHSFSIGR